MSAGPWDTLWLETHRQSIHAPQAWRGVETQYASATQQLVDNWSEHDLLEALIEQSKPAPVPETATRHFLLTTPFRYVPGHASRFRAQGKAGIWYGAATLLAACAEVAYWRMRFVLDSAGLITKKLYTSHTFFAAVVRGDGIQLTTPPWVDYRALWIADSYTETHRLAEAAGDAGIEVIQYESARAPGNACFAVLSPRALHEPTGGLQATFQRWSCTASRDTAMMHNELDPAQRFEFGR